MIEYIIFFIIGLLFVSCKETEKDRVSRLVHEWSGKEIVYPNNLYFTVLGNDTNYLPKKEFTIVTYVDSIGCTSCRLKLMEWKRLITQLDSMENTSVLFFIHPKDKKEMTYVLKRDNFTHPVCLDEEDAFNKLNKLPTDMMFQTFLLNKDNKVVAVGNPIHNPKVKELYLTIVLGDKVPKQAHVSKTDIQLSDTSVDMGTFDWRKEQKSVFTLTNIGEFPLVIIDVATSCGCVSASYSKEPVQPGKDINLSVTYKADHPEYFNKTITVYCNTKGSPFQLKISGNAKEVNFINDK